MSREKLPAVRHGVTHKFVINADDGDGKIRRHKFYLSVNVFPERDEDAFSDNPLPRPAEVFVTAEKEGSTIGGLLDVVGILMSFCLQHGVPLNLIVEKLSHTRFEPAGMTETKSLRFAKSPIDYIARWMGETYLGIPAQPPVPPEE